MKAASATSCLISFLDFGCYGEAQDLDCSYLGTLIPSTSLYPTCYIFPSRLKQLMPDSLKLMVDRSLANYDKLHDFSIVKVFHGTFQKVLVVSGSRLSRPWCLRDGNDPLCILVLVNVPVPDTSFYFQFLTHPRMTVACTEHTTVYLSVPVQSASPSPQANNHHLFHFYCPATSLLQLKQPFMWLLLAVFCASSLITNCLGETTTVHL